mmetsp:Transcript_8862/g.20505  ORF Transcript_8862/g.20505 Transcript_8862/m.20505 type:complete len:196 (+) Transcript_8862:41-628(+)
MRSPTVTMSHQPYGLLTPESCPSPEFERPTLKSTFKKSVAFNQVVQVHLELHYNDMTDEEFFGAWYQKRDFQMMKVEDASTIKKLTSGDYEADDDTQSSRGLEFRFGCGAQRRKLNKLRARLAVLGEQKRQEDCGIYDEEAVRFVYMQESAECKEHALDLAEEDAAEASKIQKEEKNKKRANRLTKRKSKNKCRN